MKTKNKKLLNPEANRAYYSKSDGNFMNLDMSLNAHKYIDRIAWAREKVHGLSSRYHLDIGTKDGYLPLLLTAEGVECIGVDPSEDAILEAQLKAKQSQYDPHYLVSTIEEYDPKGFVFDTVSMLEVLEHVVDEKATLDKLSQLGQFILISTPDYYGRHGIQDARQNDEHVRLFKKEELEELCSQYGEVVECIVRDDQILIMYKSKYN